VKTLLILRHAKSSWKYRDLPDHERPLNRRGVNDAPRMGAILRQAGWTPDRIVSSTAVRAQSTARLAGHASGYDGGVELREELYLSPAQTYLDVLGRMPAGAGTVMIVGHNPTVEELVRLLTGRDETMPTAALARVELPIDDWAELAASTPGKLRDLWRPRDL
jgi:phosphohistidine phosphatase